MASEDNGSKQRTVIDITKQFLLGTTFGLLVMLIPLSYISISATALTLSYVIILAVFILSCGILAATFGSKFLSPLTKFLESIPPVG